jgi:hypothetical protein
LDAFLGAMRTDLTVTRYGTYQDLLTYMEGSAAAIGLMMLPVLETVPGAERAAREPARELGRAFQLTNFLRDVAEDLARGRVYLPKADLAEFGVTEADLAAASSGRAVRDLVAFESARARGHYRRALDGVELLVPSSRPCIRAACELYGGILRQITEVGHDVLAARARVPRRRRAAIFARHLLGGAALPVDGDAGDLLGQPGGEPAGAGDVAGLRADGVDAAEHDVLDGGRVDLRPVHERGEDVRAEVGGVHAGEPAAPPSHGGADGVDDVCLGHGVFSFVQVLRTGA